MRSFVVGTHNLMSGLRLRALFRYYLNLRNAVGLDLLCVQENRRTAIGLHAEQIADVLGRHYDAVSEAPGDGLGIVYDRRRLRCVDHELVPLPMLERLNVFQRWYIDGGKPTRKFAQLAVFEPAAGARFAIVNFHLDTAGTNTHRRQQVQTFVDALVSRRVADRCIACGDTNAFQWRQRAQRLALRELLSPLAAIGARDPGTRATHYFARQNEPKWTHQLGVALGRVGIDVPGRFDVVCTNLPVGRRGQMRTLESDHDLVWASFTT